MYRTTSIALLLLVAFGLSIYGTGCGSSTRISVTDDDEDETESSGPYSSDLVEVTDEIVNQIKRQRVVEDFHARWDDAPIIAVIRPQNDTRFPEVTQIFQENLVAELMERFPRRDLRFSQRDSDVQAEISEEKGEKESGERTDRTGRRKRLGADFFLKAKFSALSKSDGEWETDTILYSFELIDTETDELLFKGRHLIKRASEKSAVYR